MKAECEKIEWNASDLINDLDIVVDLDYLALIPNWCQMHPNDHFDGMGGCWGISSNRIGDKGVLNSNGAYCNGCTFNRIGNVIDDNH